MEIEYLYLISDEISILLKKRAESHNNTEPDSSAEAQEDSENIALPLSSQPENNSEQPLEENPGESADAEPVDDTLDGAEPIEAAPFDDTSVNDTPIDDTPDDAEPVGTGGNVGVDNSPDETPPGDVTSVEPGLSPSCKRTIVYGSK